MRQREDRDRSLLASGATDAKQLTELQHELDTLERRQSSLEDSLLEVMERREELQGQQAAELAKIDELQKELGEAQQACDDVRTRDRPAASPISLAARRTRHRSGRRSGGAVRAPAGSRRRGRRPAAGASLRRLPARDRPRRTGQDLRCATRTMFFVARSAVQSCCGSRGPEHEGHRRGRRRLAWQSRDLQATERWCGPPTTTPFSPSASRRSAVPPTTSPSTAA